MKNALLVAVLWWLTNGAIVQGSQIAIAITPQTNVHSYYFATGQDLVGQQFYLSNGLTCCFEYFDSPLASTNLVDLISFIGGNSCAICLNVNHTGSGYLWPNVNEESCNNGKYWYGPQALIKPYSYWHTGCVSFATNNIAVISDNVYYGTRSGNFGATPFPLPSDMLLTAAILTNAPGDNTPYQVTNILIRNVWIYDIAIDYSGLKLISDADTNLLDLTRQIVLTCSQLKTNNILASQVYSLYDSTNAMTWEGVAFIAGYGNTNSTIKVILPYFNDRLRLFKIGFGP